MEITEIQYLDACRIKKAFEVNMKTNLKKYRQEAMLRIEREATRMQGIESTTNFLIEKFDLTNKTRKQEYVVRRQALMYWLRINTTMSWNAIARIFGKDHSSVIHSCKIIESYLSYRDERMLLYCNEMWSVLNEYKKKK